MDREKVEPREVIYDLARTVKVGGVAMLAAGVGYLEYVAINQDGDASLYEICYPYFGVPAEKVSGIKLSGVMRRDGIRRQFVECSTNDIKTGDKAVLVDEEGNQVTTHRLRPAVNL